jgi:1-acyl-sn-glycerol-3-phosphate acyltransferase
MEPWNLVPARDTGLSPLERLRSPRRESGLVSSSLHHLWGALVRSYLAIWHRLTIHRPENLPARTPFVLVANHTSHLDAIVLAAALHWQLRDRVFPLAAGDVFFNSPYSTTIAANLLNALPVWRKKMGGRTFQALRQRLLEESCGFILFPEGGRSRNGHVMPFKGGVGMLVAQTAVPVVPCWLSGCFSALPPGSKLPRRKRIALYVGESLQFGHVQNDKHGWQLIAQTLETAVRQLEPTFDSERSRDKESAISMIARHESGTYDVFLK